MSKQLHDSNPDHATLKSKSRYSDPRKKFTDALSELRVEEPTVSKVDHVAMRTNLVTKRHRWPKYGEHQSMEVPIALRDYIRALLTLTESHPQGVRILEAVLDLTMLYHHDSERHMSQGERSAVTRMRNKSRRKQLMELRVRALDHILLDSYRYLIE
jgi:hypothetical protein